MTNILGENMNNSVLEKTLNIIFSNDVENSYYKFILAKENNYDY